jgi:hypothetical protein
MHRYKRGAVNEPEGLYDESRLRSPRVRGDEFVRPSSPVIGREDAPVTVAEFFDPAYEAYRAFFV